MAKEKEFEKKVQGEIEAFTKEIGDKLVAIMHKPEFQRLDKKKQAELVNNYIVASQFALVMGLLHDIALATKEAKKK